MEPFVAPFYCGHCQTRVDVEVRHFGEMHSWTCAGCGLEVEDRTGPPSSRRISGLSMWLGEQLVEELTSDECAGLRQELIAPIAPIFSALACRLIERHALLSVSIEIISSVLRQVRTGPFTPQGRYLLSLANDLPALATHFRAKLGTAWHLHDDLAVLLEGPPPAWIRGPARLLPFVFALVYSEEPGGFRLKGVSGWQARAPSE